MDEINNECSQEEIDALVEKYDQLRCSASSGSDRVGSAAEDTINEITEWWIDQAISGGRLSQEQAEHLRTKCTIPSSVRIGFTGTGRKRATTDYFLSNEAEGERNGRATPKRKRRPKKKPAQKQQQQQQRRRQEEKKRDNEDDDDDDKSQQQSQSGSERSQQSDDDMEQSDDDDDNDEAKKKSGSDDESMAQEDDDDERSYQSIDDANEDKDRPPTEEEAAAALARTTASEAKRKVAEASMESDDEGPTPVRRLTAFVPRELQGRQDELVSVRKELMEFRASRADFYLKEEGYNSEYALVEVPSFMDQTEDSVDDCYSNEDDQVDVGIKRFIQNGIDLHSVGMKAAPLFLGTGDRVWTPVSFTSMAELAIVLEDTTSTPTPEDANMRGEVQKALDNARKSQRFTLPRDTTTRSLARNYLAMGEEMRSLLFTLVHSAAGAHAFRLLELDELTTEKNPILTKEVLALLEYNYEGELQETSELLKRFKAAFDDENISYEDKTTLMLGFLRIKKLLQNLPDEKWEIIDRSSNGQSDGSEGSQEANSRRYFNTSAHQNNALTVLTITVASDFIHEHTFEDVAYEDFEGLAPIMYRNSLDYMIKKGAAKLMMTKVYDGTATQEYMEGVYSGLGEMVVKSAFGRGQSPSTYSDNIPILFHLLTSEGVMDDLLGTLGYDSSNNSYIDSDEEEEEEDEHEYF